MMERSFDITYYRGLTTAGREKIWSEAKKALQNHDPVQFTIRNFESPSKVRKEIYDNFGGYQIQFYNYFGVITVLITPEKIRTSATSTGTHQESLQEFPEDLCREETAPSGFSIVSHKLCPVCERKLPESAFNKHHERRVQSYCKVCSRMYAKWRRELLATRRIQSVRGVVTTKEGSPNHRNDLFRDWLKTHQ